MLLVMLSTAHAIEVVDTAVGDADVMLDVGGFVQPRFTWIPQDAAANSTGELGWSVTRVRPEIKGVVTAPTVHFGGELTLAYKISIEMMPEARLQDAYAEVRLYDPVRVRVG